MAEKEIFERGYDFGGVVQTNDRDSKFDVLGERIEKLKNEIVSTSQCFDYILKEISSENENIVRLLKWNDKRLNLLSELSIKIKNMNVKLNGMYEEMFCILKENFKTQK